MKKWIGLISAVAAALMLAAGPAHGEDALGIGNLALKTGYIGFTDSDLEDLDVDAGWYGAVEAYGAITEDIYVGVEVGFTAVSNSDVFNGEFFDIDLFDTEIDIDLTYVPIELNAKYVYELTPGLVVDAGAGVSYNWAEIEVEDAGKEDDWVFGGQMFIDLNYTIGSFFFGAHAKYQMTQEGDDLEVNFDNWRVGGHIGVLF